MWVTILKPDGTSLTSNNMCGSGSFNNMTLPSTGTYTVLVNPQATTGGATFTLTQNTTQTLAFNTTLTVSSTNIGQVFDLTFSGTAGQVVSLAATNITYPCWAMWVTILKPDGTSLTSNNMCGSGSFNNVTLPSTGTYTVLVNPGANTGGATFTLTENITEAIVANAPLAVSSTLAGQLFDLAFSGTAGQVVSLGITNITYPCWSMHASILKPDGTTLVTDYFCGSGSINNVSLPTTGTYTVLVNPLATTGGATLTLSQ